jgi:hypothetical protein
MAKHHWTLLIGVIIGIAISRMNVLGVGGKK